MYVTGRMVNARLVVSPHGTADSVRWHVVVTVQDVYAIEVETALLDVLLTCMDQCANTHAIKLAMTRLVTE